MRTKIIIIFLLLTLSKYAKPGGTENSLQTNLHLAIKISEIKIKDIREAVWDDTGEFYFYRDMADVKVRLPISGEINRKVNQYIRPIDKGLDSEPFWHYEWTEAGTNSRLIEFDGWEEDSGNDDHLGKLSHTLDLSNFKFISENTNKMLETGDYNIIFTITCAPVISSPTHPDSTRFYNQSELIIEWSHTLPAGGILGYSYMLDHTRCTVPDDTTEGTHTSTFFNNLAGGTYWFHLRAIDKTGFSSNVSHFKVNIETSVDVSGPLAENQSFQLYPNYPNPFNESTVISYQLFEPAYITIQILTVTGRLIHTLKNDFEPPGNFNIIWDAKDDFGNDVSSGVYVCVLRAGQFVTANKMTLLR